MTEQTERCDRGSGKEPPDWRQEVGTDPTEHHVVEVVQLLAPGHSDQIVRLVAICACGWRSGEHQVYLGASTGWAAERARRHLETAGIAHVRSLSPLPS
ncbi:MAG: hypothetical protein ACRDYA_23970 [Egibacteraceae bacterium]